MVWEISDSTVESVAQPPSPGTQAESLQVFDFNLFSDPDSSTEFTVMFVHDPTVAISATVLTPFLLLLSQS